MLNLSTVFSHSATDFPTKTAIIFGDKSFSYGEVEGSINMIANGLKDKGLGKGDHIALSCPNLPYFPMVYYAILKIGATVVPLNVLLKPREIAYHLKDSDAKAYLCFEGTSELPMAEFGYEGFSEVDACKHFWVMTGSPAGPSPVSGTETLGALMQGQAPTCEVTVTQPNDTAVILYTSGTTGFPKGAELTHSNMFMNALASKDLLQLVPGDVHVVVLPLFHSFGQTVQMNAGFLSGNTEILIPRFQPELVLSAIQDKGASVLAAVPTMYWALLNLPDASINFDLKKISETLRIGVSGGAALPVEIIRQVKETYDIPVIEGYGLSETSPVATFNHLHKGLKPGSIGTAIWGVEVRIVDENSQTLPAGSVGEVAVRGTNVMKGYYNRPEETKQAFKGTTWFHTGDLGKMDEDEYFYIVDRVKDMVLRGGFNVYPREIEEILLTHPAVSLAAVIGVPDEEYGEEIKAILVMKPGYSETESEMVAWGKKQMASYKYPRIVEFRDSLPMNATGKILKKELRKE